MKKTTLNVLLLVLCFLTMMLLISCVANTGNTDNSSIEGSNGGSSTTDTNEGNGNSNTNGGNQDNTDIPSTNEKYIITFSQGDGYPDVTREVEKGRDLTDIPTPKKIAGYDVVWEDKDLTDIQGNMTVIAIKTPINYKVEYVLNGGINHSDNILSYNITTSFTFLNPTQQGYIFKGWFTDENLNNPISNISVGTVGDKILYAKWEENPNMITVTFNSNGGSEVPTQSVEKGSNVLEPSTPTKEGYELVGWYLNGEKWFFEGYSVSSSITLTAEWKAVEYDIIYHNCYDYTNDNPTKHTIESVIDLSPITNKYIVFEGWYFDSAFEEPVTQLTGKIGTVDLYAKWSTSSDVFDFNEQGDGTYEIVSMSRTIPHIVFPSNYNGEKVTSIDLTFSTYTEKISSIVVPEGIINAEFCIFYDDSTPSEVVLPNSLKTLNVEFLYGAEPVDIENGVEYFGNWAVGIEDSDTSRIIIREGTLGIAESFTTTVGDLVLPSNLKVINAKFIQQLENVYVGSVKQWLDFNFAHETKNPLFTGVNLYVDNKLLTEVVIPNGVEKINKYAFYGCKSIKRVIISQDVLEIGEFAFGNCISLENIELPSDIETMPLNAFSGCSSLVSLQLPNGITEFDISQLVGCTSLKSITLSKSVNNFIGNNKDVMLTEILVDTENQNFKLLDGHLYSKDGTIFVRYVQKSNETSFEIEAGVVSIGESAFFENTYLQEIEIPSSVSTVEKYAFYGCSSLKSIVLTDNVREINDCAFENCSSAVNICLPKEVDVISISAFKGCSSVGKIILPEGTISMPNFSGCTSLKSISIPASLTEIYVSYWGSMLDEAPIEEFLVSENNQSYKAIDKNLYTKDGKTLIRYAIGKTNSIFEVPEEVTTIYARAFYGCTSLETIAFYKSEGWTVTDYNGDAISIDVTDQSLNVELLTSQYYRLTWTNISD